MQRLPTTAAGDATKLARQAINGGADLVLVLGGDGTINEVANGMVPSAVPLGVLPGGTANVLAMELGFGSNVEKAAARLGKSVAKRISVGRFAGEANPSENAPRYFLMMGGVGLDATIVTNVNPRWKAKLGKLAYWAAGAGEFFHSIGQFDVLCDGQRHTCGFALASRVRNYGGDLEIASAASLLSDDFELVTFDGTNPIRYAAYMAAVVARQVKKMPGVRVTRAREIEFQGTAHIQIDGEYMGESPAKLEIVRDALTLLMPESYR